MAKKVKKRVRREYTKAEEKELRAHSKARTPVKKIQAYKTLRSRIALKGQQHGYAARPSALSLPAIYRMQTPAEDVRSWQKNRKYLLAVSISLFDPERTSEGASMLTEFARGFATTQRRKRPTRQCEATECR